MSAQEREPDLRLRHRRAAVIRRHVDPQRVDAWMIVKGPAERAWAVTPVGNTNEAPVISEPIRRVAGPFPGIHVKLYAGKDSTERVDARAKCIELLSREPANPDQSFVFKARELGMDRCIHGESEGQSEQCGE